MSTFKSEYQRQIADRRIQYERDQDSVVEALDRLSGEIGGRNAREDRAIKGIYVWGAVGRGKSMLMDLFFEHVDEPAKWRIHFHAFMQEVHKTMQPSGDEPNGDPIARAAMTLLRRAHLLCLDELEVVDIADAMILGRLFDRLFAQGLILVATSNDHPDDLYRGGPNRELFAPFVERLKQHVQIVQFGGSHDHRSDGDPDPTAYLHPITPETKQRFEQLWRQASNGEPERSASLPVHGRHLDFDRCCKSSVRATFDELCRRPLSADDHLAMTERFASIFLEDVPVIPADQVDEGRRLVTLIDAIYDSGARLVALAASQPENVFEHIVSEDQRRTISRLSELKGNRRRNWNAVQEH